MKVVSRSAAMVAEAPGRDVLSPEQRRLCMSRNRGTNTKPEIRLRRACFALGLRFRVKNDILGRPDFVFPRQKIAVFVDGCFWHGCPLHYKPPTTRREFWAAKRDSNWERDESVNKRLLQMEWLPLRVWEHELTPNKATHAATAILGQVRRRDIESDVKRVPPKRGRESGT